MSKFDDDLARGCLPTGEPLESLYGIGWWTEHDEPVPYPYDLYIAELESRIADLEKKVDSAVKKAVTFENKNRNLQKVIAKQQVKIQRQAENLTILLDLYTSGKRSKSHKKLREKYRLLKASFNEWKRG